MEYILNIYLAFWATLCEMAPYLLFGFFMAGVLSIVISPKLIERHLGGNGFKPILKASLFGVPLPLCSCSVIPVATSLRRNGSSKAATTAFLLSTPQTGIDSIMATFSLLGPVFAIFRPAAAFITGILGGVIVDIISTEDGKKEAEESTCQCSSDMKRGSKIAHVFRHAFITLPRDIAKPLFAGLLIAGLMSALVPPSFFSRYLGGGFASMIVMLVLGIPIYVCATASIPIASAMIIAGVSPGAALVFLMTGPATNAAALGAIWRILGKRETIIYLAVVAITALTCGILLDLLFDITATRIGELAPWMLPQWVKTTAAIILLAVLGFSMVQKK
jgi:uncharacterized membrane protein YraQ (UPF0718 family)